MAAATTTSAFNSTSASLASAASAGTKAGLKRQVEALEAELRLQGSRLGELSKRVGSDDDNSSDILETLRLELQGSMKELRAEMMAQIGGIKDQLTQLQRQINVSRGEANILAQQNKDAMRRIGEVADQVQRLAVEIVGEDDVAEAEAATA